MSFYGCTYWLFLKFGVCVKLSNFILHILARKSNTYSFPSLNNFKKFKTRIRHPPFDQMLSQFSPVQITITYALNILLTLSSTTVRSLIKLNTTATFQLPAKLL
jgi:hypothetical protein